MDYLADPLRIGLDNFENAFFNGIIDEVRIYNRALSADEIKELYKNPSGLKTNLIIGRITNLNTGLGNFITFNAEKISCLQFFPLRFNRYSSDEEIRIAKQYLGILKPNRIFGLFKASICEKPIGPDSNDLTIGWVARLPRIDYVWGSTNPEVEGWPIEGEQVTWQANVKNWLTTDVQGVTYKWYLDGMEVAIGTVDILAGSTVTVDYPWNWTFTRHMLKFVIDTENIVPEDEEENNELTIFTDAISVGFYVEQSVYDYFHQYQEDLGVHSNCWEDWGQRHVSRWNQMFTDAIYPETPNGVLDRIRIDKITIVPDGALPLAGGLPSNNPNMSDRTVDLQWGFPASLLDGNFYADHSSVTDDNPFYFEGSLLHELGHARYLIDVYGFNVHDDGSGNTVGIRENGELIVGTEYMPFIEWDAVYYSPWKGLMNGQYTFIDRYSAVALNLIAGHRATRGNYNAPENIGIYLNDLPDQNQLTVKDKSGNILADADIKIYQATEQPGVWYGKYYDNTPDIQLTSDTNGQVLLGRCPFDGDGTIEHTYGRANGVIIIRVEKDGSVGYTFLEATLFNLEYWRGNTAMGSYEVQVNLINNVPSKPNHLIGLTSGKPFNLFKNLLAFSESH